MIYFTFIMMVAFISVTIIGLIMDYYRLKTVDYKYGTPLLGKVTVTGLSMALILLLGLLMYCVVMLVSSLF